MPTELIEAIRCPAGVDLGHTTHNEMAVSILAELVQLRATGVLSGVDAAELPQTFEAVDPVCGMTVTVDRGSHRFEHRGETYYFCCPGCRTAFEKDPASYLAEGAQ